LNWYTCASFRPLRAEGNRDAARVFATREAVKRYGKKGLVRVLNENARSRDGRVVEWQAFIGKATGRNETTGHNVHLTVTMRKGGAL
jgi:hypothetical protein